MDKTIVMFSLKENYKIRVMQGDHDKGVRRLSYTPLNGGYLTSVGYEVFANLWCPESVVADVLIG